MSDPEIVMSPLCREITGDGTRIQDDIYRGEDESGIGDDHETDSHRVSCEGSPVRIHREWEYPKHDTRRPIM